MVKVHRAKRYVLRLCSRCLSCVAAEYDDIQKGVAHQTVSSMDAADCLTCNKQIVDHLCEAVPADLQTAVLIMKGRIDENRFLTDIDPVFSEHSHHSGNSLLDSSFAVYHFDKRRIQPDAFAVRSLDSAVVFLTFPNNRGGRDVARLQRIDKRYTVFVDELRAQRTHFFGNQSAVNLRRRRRARGMILQRFGIEQFCARAIGEHEPVRSRPVMVGRGEALIMQPARAARCDNDCFCPGDEYLFRFHIHEHRARGFAVRVLDQFDRGSEIHYRDTAVKDFVAQDAHNFRTRIVAAGVHSLAGSSPAVSRNHGSVGRLVEHNAEVI